MAAILNIGLGDTFYSWEHSGCLLQSYKEPEKVSLDESWGYKGTPSWASCQIIMKMAAILKMADYAPARMK